MAGTEDEPTDESERESPDRSAAGRAPPTRRGSTNGRASENGSAPVTRGNEFDHGRASADGEGDDSSRDDPPTCQYVFDPTQKTDAHLQTTWECPHDAHADSEFCVFHMNYDERKACGVTAAEVIARLKENLKAEDTRANEYVGADLPHLSLTYQDINGDTNHVLNFQHADIDGIDITHGRLDQGLNLREATVGTLKLEDAIVTGLFEAPSLTVEGSFVTDESTFHQDVHFEDADFRGPVDCDEATFTEDTSFAGATFHDVAHFRNVQTSGTSHVLEDRVSFADVEFRDDTSFRQADFEYATFEGATFHAESDFEHAIFDGDVQFDRVTFHQVADFDEARFDDDVSFEEARFMALAEFRGVEFNGGSRTSDDDVTFENATFEAEADFKLARFRFADFKDATFEGDLNFDRARFDARADCHRISVAGRTDLRRVEFVDTVNFDGSEFADEVTAVEAEFGGDADFVKATFDAVARFTEARFREDASFRASTFRDRAVFRGAVFEGEAKHLEENASFEEVAFLSSADFEAARFTNASFRGATFHDECRFRSAEFLDGVNFRVLAGDDDVYVDLTEATVDGGSVVLAGGDPVLYDLTKATVGELQLESEGSEHELLDHFRVCLTDFDHFDFSNHHGYLERNDWNVHAFLGDDRPATPAPTVEMTDEVIEETYRKAQDSADAVGDTPASREFEFKRYYYNRKKNLDIIRNEYSLNGWSRAKKASSVALNYFMQFTCGYGNRLPRIAALTFFLPALFGVLYVLGGPFQTQAGVLWSDGTLDPKVLFDGLYYSYISFSTIGYGDIGPVGWAAKLLAMSQGMLNGLFFTLLTFTLFKRVLGGS